MKITIDKFNSMNYICFVVILKTNLATINPSKDRITTICVLLYLGFSFRGYMFKFHELISYIKFNSFGRQTDSKLVSEILKYAK